MKQFYVVYLSGMPQTKKSLGTVGVKLSGLHSEGKHDEDDDYLYKSFSEIRDRQQIPLVTNRKSF